MEALTEWGYVGLFISAFLAATILPLSSEVVLTALLLSDLQAVLLILVATLGNVLGSCTNYGLGYWAGKPAASRFLKMSESDFTAAERRFDKYGKWSLLLSWVPLIGDPITVVAGIFRMQLLWFILLVTLAKLGRYSVLAYLVMLSQ